MKGLGCQTCFQVQALEVCHRATRLRRLKGWLRKTASKNVTSTSFIILSPSIPFAFLFFCTKKKSMECELLSFVHPCASMLRCPRLSPQNEGSLASPRAELRPTFNRNLWTKYVQNMFKIHYDIWFCLILFDFLLFLEVCGCFLVSLFDIK